LVGIMAAGQEVFAMQIICAFNIIVRHIPLRLSFRLPCGKSNLQRKRQWAP
jgi:hypothetical protein